MSEYYYIPNTSVETVKRLMSCKIVPNYYMWYSRHDIGIKCTVFNSSLMMELFK